jgi:hypothetical protein
MAKQRKENCMTRHTGHSIADVVDQADAATNIIGGVPVLFTFALADGATATTTYTVRNKIEIIDVIVEKRAGAGGASDTLQVKNNTDAVTDAIDINIADKVVKRAGTIDDAFSTISAGGTLAITKTKASAANVACLVTVVGIRRA